MTKAIYIGVGGLARKVKKVYFGVSGIARKVKSGYIGVGGLARLFWSGGEPAYFKSTTFSSARYQQQTGTIGNYALFAGGSTVSSASTQVDVFDSVLTQSNATALGEAKFKGGSARAGSSYLIFAGGAQESAYARATVYAYNSALTRSVPAALHASKFDMGAASVGSYALFAGGYPGDTPYYKVTEAYNTALTKSTPDPLDDSRYDLVGGTAGNYAVFAGGYGNSSRYYTEAYNSSLTHSSLANRDSVSGAATANFNNCAYFLTTNCTFYNSSLTVSSLTNFFTAFYASATAVGDYLFVGGSGQDVEVLDKSNTKFATLSLTVARYSAGAASIGNYAIFGSGTDRSSPSSSSHRSPVVDIFTI